MKTWKACPQYNGEDISLFQEIEFPVPEKLFAKINTALKHDIPLKECSFYSDLVKRACDKFDFSDYIDLDDKPEREDFESREEYLEALAEFNAMIEDDLDSFYFIDANIYDPNDELRFARKIQGKVLLESDFYTPGDTSAEIEILRDDEVPATYYITLKCTEDGVIVSVEDMYADATEYDGVTGGSIASCYIDFQYVWAYLEDEELIEINWV